MYPGSGNQQYGNQQYGDQQYNNQQYGNQQYNNQQGYYRPPSGPPSNFHRPPGPPQQYQNGYQQNGYSRPSVPPPSQYLDQGQDQSRDRSYQRPMAPPPLTPQSFGYGTNNTFLYSTCQGRKKALLVGINYAGSKNALRGCINDVKNMSNFLVSHYGYKYEDMVILTDDQNQMNRIPLKENIIRAMQWLVKDARPNDSLFFHYSGHGGQTKDLDGDEEDGMDDVIYPLDFQTNGPIIDDLMHDVMVKPLPQGCRLTALYDSCHSGTALDLPFVYSTKGVVKEPNMMKDAGMGALNAVLSYTQGNIGGAISALGGIAKRVSRGGSSNRDQVIRMKMSPADVVSISGCKDDQTSADANENGMATGAMSWSFIQTLSQQPQQSYLALLNNMRGILAPKYSQKPQLSSSHPMDMNIQFIM
ncbi:hypothetical protein BABINDRAFT_161043 [Babjeviella inositovora NRRL Y-12698]|uniref:Metacaspase-1 n=1 Tax=Babjeviella inositovora NRRL Y-12698 TaxID=984486 RepID=A0A1E3QT45_9ASCO|nr:uncharacterized protein BABINDRAFT_161043 [Babjeviella inositovora NRRL Y-12698]ODQ80840.1 hypothetical protein BABINDRAFT_161043 [Babjeviella inositovora NRRL Y-12698]